MKSKICLRSKPLWPLSSTWFCLQSWLNICCIRSSGCQVLSLCIGNVCLLIWQRCCTAGTIYLTHLWIGAATFVQTLHHKLEKITLYANVTMCRWHQSPTRQVFWILAFAFADAYCRCSYWEREHRLQRTKFFGLIWHCLQTQWMLKQHCSGRIPWRSTWAQNPKSSRLQHVCPHTMSNHGSWYPVNRAVRLLTLCIFLFRNKYLRLILHSDCAHEHFHSVTVIMYPVCAY